MNNNSNSSLDGCKYKEDYTRDYNPEKVGTPEEQAKALHHTIDWMKAVCNRKDDHRQPSNEWVLDMLKRIQAGHRVDTEVGWPIHYTGD